MRRGAALVAAALAGAVLGAAVMLSLPVRLPDGPARPRPRNRRCWATPLCGPCWRTPGQLPDGFADAVAGLRAARVAVVRSGIAWLDAWGDDSAPAGRPRATASRWR